MTGRRLDPPDWLRPAERVVRRPSWSAPPSSERRRAPSLRPAPAVSERPPPSERRAEEPAPSSRRGAAHVEEEISAIYERPVSILPLASETFDDGEAEALRAEVAELAASLASVRQRILEALEPDVVRLALAVAERVVGRELALDPDLVFAWTREALATLPAREEIVVAVAPDVASRLPESSGDATFGPHRLVVDASLPPGTCEVREGASVAPAGAKARLDAMADVLGVES